MTKRIERILVKEWPFSALGQRNTSLWIWGLWIFSPDWLFLSFLSGHLLKYLIWPFYHLFSGLCLAPGKCILHEVLGIPSAVNKSWTVLLSLMLPSSPFPLSIPLHLYAPWFPMLCIYHNTTFWIHGFLPFTFHFFFLLLPPTVSGGRGFKKVVSSFIPFGLAVRRMPWSADSARQSRGCFAEAFKQHCWQKLGGEGRGRNGGICTRIMQSMKFITPAVC